MSNTPILSGEKIAIFVLAPRCTDTEPGLGVVSESKFKPVGFPIIADFDEDTDFRNISYVSPYAERYFKEYLRLYRKDRNADDEYDAAFFEYEWEGIEKFLVHLMGWQLFVKCEDGVIRRLSYAMMHEELRNNLLEHVSSRIPYGKKETYRNLMTEKVQEAIKKCKVGYADWLSMPDNIRQKYHWDSKFTLWSKIDCCEEWDNLDTMATYYVLNPDNDIVDDVVDYAIWRTVMCYSRKGYHCYPAGTQCEDMQFHKIIAEFTLQKYDERKSSRRVEEILTFY
jgi:hypothetical protein